MLAKRNERSADFLQLLGPRMRFLLTTDPGIEDLAAQGASGYENQPYSGIKTAIGARDIPETSGPTRVPASDENQREILLK